MGSGSTRKDALAGHPRLLRCDVVNRAGGAGLRYVELEQFRLWEYMMRTRHGIEVRGLRVGLWLTSPEFRANAGPLLHGGTAEEVTQITISAFNTRHHYTLDTVRYVPTDQFESVKEILMSHVADSGLEGQNFDVRERHGVCVSRAIEDPEIELVLGLSDMEMQPDGGATAS